MRKKDAGTTTTTTHVHRTHDGRKQSDAMWWRTDPCLMIWVKRVHHHHDHVPVVKAVSLHRGGFFHALCKEWDDGILYANILTCVSFSYKLNNLCCILCWWNWFVCVWRVDKSFFYGFYNKFRFSLKFSISFRLSWAFWEQLERQFGLCLMVKVVGSSSTFSFIRVIKGPTLSL